MTDLFKPKTRVRHKKHPVLVGRIQNLEYSEPGKLSPLPYKVYWDDDAKAAQLLGNFWLYPPHEFLEEVAEPATP